MSAPVSRPARVLILDAAEESRQIVGELLRRTGIESDTAAGVAEAARRLDAASIETIVVEADAFTAAELRLLLARAARSGAAIVLVGTNRPEGSPPTLTLVRKPYHYPELIHKIVASLGIVGTQARAVA